MMAASGERLRVSAFASLSLAVVRDVPLQQVRGTWESCGGMVTDFAETEIIGKVVLARSRSRAGWRTARAGALHFH